MKLPSFVQKAFIAVLTTYFRYLVMVVIAVIFAAGYVWLIRPQFENVRIVGVLALKNETERLENRQAYYLKAKKMVDQYQTASEGIGGIAEKILPSSNSNTVLFKTAQAIAREARMTLDSVAISEGKSAIATAPAAQASGQTGTSTSSAVKTVDVSMSMSGDMNYSTYKNILLVLERSMRMIDLGSVSYRPVEPVVSTPGRPDAVETSNSISLSFKTYYLDQSAVTK